MSIYSRIRTFFSFEPDPLLSYEGELAKINALEVEIAVLSQEQIRAEIEKFKAECSAITEDATLFKKLLAIRPRVFALTREAARRSIGQFHYNVQLVGGCVLSEGKIAEMKTGEGKTLTATLPLVLFALAGRGAHLVTVNDYLSRWQASVMGQVYSYLGLSVASIQHEQSFLYDPTFQPEEQEIKDIESQVQGLVLDVKHMRPTDRKAAYAADITYGTNNEFGFDYLRDNMAQSLDRVVQRELFFAIVDEVDSILIDEARTPLIISAPDTEPTSKYYDFAKIVGQLQEEADYTVDEKHKAASLSDEGITKIEKILNVENIYDTTKGVTTLHHIEQALRAKTLFKIDRDYVVRDGEIVIVDEFTGRLMFGRRYSQGLHQAIEAKENVKIQQESKTLATITFQNLFRLYKKLSGMTGTGKTEEEEFFKIYQLHVVPFEILNAKNHEREAHIIAQAGRFGAVTLATNIAGRGVDILLGGNPVDAAEADEVRKAGGLAVVGTERHESRRIDNQLRGRSGRQGDPGESLFFVSMEDDLMRLFGGERMKNLMNTLGLPDDQPIEARMVSRSIEQAQKKIEGINFDTRKHVLEFDDVLNHQRTTIYNRRRKMLTAAAGADTTLRDEILGLVKEEIAGAVTYHLTTTAVEHGEDDALKAIAEAVNALFPLSSEAFAEIISDNANAADREFALTDDLYEAAVTAFEQKEQEIGKDVYAQIQRFVVLQAIDSNWMEHLDTMDHLRDSVRLRGYGQRDPLVEYKKEGFVLFKRLTETINQTIARTVLRVSVQAQAQPQQRVVPLQMVTNLSDGSSAGASASTSTVAESNVGRNDPCPCGSGKKWKKCGMVNSEEHQKNMARR